MELRAGYKNTEIGMIPEDWELKKVGDCFKIDNNLRFPISQEVRNSMQGIYPYYGPTKIQDYINEYRVDGEYALIGEDGDHFLKWYTHSMTQLVTGKFNVNNHAHLIKGNKKNTTTIWFYYYFKNRDITQYLARQGAGRYKLSKAGLINLPCAIPKPKEQTAIATVLSDTDNLIQTLEKKITKKRLIKQGTMQELLKPKESWVVKPLGKFVNFSNGKAHENHIDVNGKYTVVNSKFVSTGGRVFKSASANFSPLKKGDIVMVMSDIPNGKALAKCFLVPKDDKYALNQRICSIRTEEVDTNYLLYILNRNKYYLAFDSGTGQTNLKKDDVLNCLIPLPKTKEEQTKIATILSNMNIEIESLEKQLAKYKQVKQGLMQNLLTGKIRLV